MTTHARQQPLEIVVAICTYNNAALLDQALVSLSDQSTPPGVEWDVLVVDNKSTDDTAAVVGRHQQSPARPRLHLVREPRQGLAHARRRAVAETSAPLIAFVDDDTRLAPEWVGEAVRFFREHPRAGVVGGRVELAWEQPPEPWLAAFGPSFAEQDHGPEPLRFPDSGVVRLVGAGFACRRQALVDSGWLSGGALVGREGTTLTAGEDLEIVLRIRRAGYEAWYWPGLRLQHFIPRRRMQVGYLCRLHHGFGRARVPLHFIETGQAPTVPRALRAFAYSVKELLRAGSAALARRRGVDRVLAKVALHEAMGRVEGAWGLLFGGRGA